MQLSQCVFHTGSLTSNILDQIAAGDMADELFTHSDNISAAFLGELKANGLLLPQPPIRVVTITPGNNGILFSMAGVAQFAADTQKKLMHLLPVDGMFFYINSQLKGVVSTKDKAETMRLYQALKQLVSEYDTEARPHVAISNCYESMCFISKCCDENHEAHLYERFLKQPIDVIVQLKDFFLYGMELPQEDDDTFFGAISQKICNAMVTEDKDQMHTALDEVLNYMIGKFPRVSGIHMRAIHFCKPLEMSLVGEDLIDRLFAQQFRLVQKIIEADNETTLRETFHQQMDLIWDYSLARKQLRHGEMMHQVVEYIEQKLSDPMLSIPAIAEAFELSEARLSAMFRQYYQETIPNFIHQRRVAYIKRQLCTTKTPIRVIAQEAGYVSIATMNRAFLRQEGMYPGQYRKKHR